MPISRNGDNKTKILSYLEKLADYTIVLFIAYLSYYPVSLIYQFKLIEGNFTLFFTSSLISLFLVFLYHNNALYTPMRTKTLGFFIGRLIIVDIETAGIALLLILLSTQGSQQNILISWLLQILLWSTVYISVKKTILHSILRSVRIRNRNRKEILLLTNSEEMAKSFMEELEHHPEYGYHLVGFVGNVAVEGCPHLGTTAELDDILKEIKPEEIWMAFDTIKKNILAKYVDICNQNCTKIMFVPAISGFFRSSHQVSMLGTLPVIDIHSTPLDNLTNRVIKRILDIVGSVLLIILTSPFMLVAVIGIKITSPGPILFKQTRIGMQNKPFTMYKFRSMRENDHETDGWSSKGDTRKTKFGTFMRRFAIDELPQFFNVLKGDMSLVGPRPEVPYYVEKFRHEIPLYMIKHSVRPGVTGRAQVQGLRGDTDIARRIEEDIYYIENWTIWSDIKILLLTPFKAINKNEVYVEEKKNE